MIALIVVLIVVVALVKIAGNTRRMAQAARIQAGLEPPPPPPLTIGETAIRLAYLAGAVGILFVVVAILT